MLHVREAACNFLPDMSRGVIVVESDIVEPRHFPQAIEELTSTASRTLAQGYAARRGMASACINGNLSGAYAVNSEGLALEHVKDDHDNPLPPAHPRMQPAAYRIDVPVCVRGG